MTNNDNKFDRARKLIAEIAASKNPMALPALPEIYVDWEMFGHG